MRIWVCNQSSRKLLNRGANVTYGLRTPHGSLSLSRAYADRRPIYFSMMLLLSSDMYGTMKHT